MLALGLAGAMALWLLSGFDEVEGLVVEREGEGPRIVCLNASSVEEEDDERDMRIDVGQRRVKEFGFFKET